MKLAIPVPEQALFADNVNSRGKGTFSLRLQQRAWLLAHPLLVGPPAAAGARRDHHFQFTNTGISYFFCGFLLNLQARTLKHTQLVNLQIPS